MTSWRRKPTTGWTRSDTSLPILDQEWCGVSGGREALDSDRRERDGDVTMRVCDVSMKPCGMCFVGCDMPVGALALMRGRMPLG